MLVQKILNIFKPNVDNKHVTVLVIEDNQVDQRVACATLEKGGYTVIKASEGQTGMALANEHKPNLIILDYNLPDIKGPDLCMALKHSEQTSKIPVLFLTSMTSPNSVMDCYEFGGENYLSKPISPKQLLKQIRLILKDQQTEN